LKITNTARIDEPPLVILQYQNPDGVRRWASDSNNEENSMWYFAWILGVLLACSFGLINAMWLEFYEDLDRDAE
jgi:cyd operon protein YbgT